MYNNLLTLIAYKDCAYLCSIWSYCTMNRGYTQLKLSHKPSAIQSLKLKNTGRVAFYKYAILMLFAVTMKDCHTLLTACQLSSATLISQAIVHIDPSAMIVMVYFFAIFLLDENE